MEATDVRKKGKAPCNAVKVYPRFDPQTLKTKQKEKSCRVLSIKSHRHVLTTEVQKYIHWMVPSDELLSGCLRQQKDNEEKQEPEQS